MKHSQLCRFSDLDGTAGLVLNCKMYIFSCLVCPMFWIPPNIPPMRFSWVGVSVSSE
jgi:hypothetical protein